MTKMVKDGGKAADARALALRVLSLAHGRDETGKQRPATEILSECLLASGLSRRDEALATELVYSTLRRRLTLDWIIETFSGVPVKRIEPPLLDVLRLGVLQIVYVESVPKYAAVDESVKLAHAAGGKKAAGFANSVLRKVPAEESSMAFPEAEKDVLKHISIVHSHPRWLVERWVERLGKKVATSVCVADNAPPPMTARVNVLKTSRERLIETLARENVQASPREETMIEITSSPGRLSELDSFREGLFYLQDVSAAVPARMLAPESGEKVLDLCSAPGGKATHIAELMGDRGIVVACDVDEARMSILSENVRRLGLRIVRPLVADGKKIDGVLKPDFDRVLLDVPCSNTGVLRRRVEARWRLKERELRRLQEAQSVFLRGAGSVVKRGGVLVYSTCSIEPEENQEVVEAFLRETKDFELKEQKTFLPRLGGGDGGYVAKLVRR
jgi:16S rRNA (cytosine967-C5)-methyltransferase